MRPERLERRIEIGWTKASLTLMKVPVTAEKLAILFEKLTGRKPTDQEIDECGAVWRRCFMRSC